MITARFKSATQLQPWPITVKKILLGQNLRFFAFKRPGCRLTGKKMQNLSYRKKEGKKWLFYVSAL